MAAPIARRTDSKNPVVNLIDNGMGKTLDQTGVDTESFYNPYNPDDLYQKNSDYSVYEEMMKDDQVSVAMAVKKDLVIGSGFSIVCEEEDDEEIKKDVEVALFEDPEFNFEDSLSDMLTAYDIGFSVTEKQFRLRDDGSLTLKALRTRSPVSWLFHQDKFGNVVRYEQQGTDREFSDIDPDSLIHFVNNPRYGRPYGVSDLRAAYTAYFVKKQIVRFYAIYLEKAASPLPVAKYDKLIAKSTDIQTIHDTIKRLQTSSALTIPKEFDIQFVESSGDGAAYVNGINMFNMFIGRALFVPDLLGFQGGEISGGSYALGEHQMRVFFKHIMRRRRTLENLINKHVIEPIVTWNHGERDNYPKFKLNPIEEKQAEANAKLWLEAVKGKVFKPTLEDVNQFKKIVEFPEMTEEQWEEDKADAIETAAALGLADDDEREDEEKADDEGKTLEGKGEGEAKDGDAEKGEGSDEQKQDFASDKPPIYLVIGVPCAGKSWVCDQLKDRFHYVPHDARLGHASKPSSYVKEIVAAAKAADKPLLAEAPFSISQIKGPLEKRGFAVTPVFISETGATVATRYYRREGRKIPRGHLTRMKTYLARADEWGAFKGTSAEVLEFLRGKAAT